MSIKLSDDLKARPCLRRQISEINKTEIQLNWLSVWYSKVLYFLFLVSFSGGVDFKTKKRKFNH